MIWRSTGFDPSQAIDPSEFTKAPTYMSARGPLILVDIRSIAFPTGAPGVSTPVKSKTVVALIDTGASSTVVSPEAINEINPLQTGFRPIHTANESSDRPEYIGQIVLPWGSTKIIKMIGCNLPVSVCHCLIGRDLMSNWTMYYDGLAGSLTICDSGR